MVNCVVVFGGESCEHDISIVTGGQLITKLDEYLYNIIPVYIDKNGEWWTGKSLLDLDNFPNNLDKLQKVSFVPNNNMLYIKKGKKYLPYVEINFAYLCLHGVNAEDGSVASIFELSKIPYSSAGVMSSALCLDKSLFKLVCLGLNINVVEGTFVDKDDFEKDSDVVLNKIQKLGLSVIVKPSRLGSSIGIEVCKSKDSLKTALYNAFLYDNRVVVEKFVDIDKEINIALFDNKGVMVYSQTEEPVYSDNILSFEDKYLKNTNGFEGIDRIKPARISGEVEEKINDISTTLYKALKMFGVVRFDFILSKSGELYVNEVNTIPGSMANYLFDKITYSELLDLIMSSGVMRFEKDKKLTHTYSSEFLTGDKRFIKK